MYRGDREISEETLDEVECPLTITYCDDSSGCCLEGEMKLCICTLPKIIPQRSNHPYVFMDELLEISDVRLKNKTIEINREKLR